jgi:hypothetical protein
MSAYSVVSFSATLEILNRFIRRGRGERRLETAQTIGLNCGVTHCPGKIEYNCPNFIMTFRTQIHKKKFGKKCFRNLQGTMSHRPLTNTSSLKIAAPYCRCLETLTFSLHKMLKCRLLCSSKFEWERTKPYCPTCVAVADFLRSHRDVACRMQCCRLRASRRPGSLI